MSSIFKRHIIHFLLLLFTWSKATGQQTHDYITRIDSLLNTSNVRPFNGVVLIAQKGKQYYAKAYGYANSYTKRPLQMNDAFSSMSIAKQVTATLILQEVEKGHLDLHKPVKTYLPYLKYAWADTITVHNLLNHTSGLWSESLELPLKFAPGRGFGYSNVGYTLAGQILEKVSQQTYQQLVKTLFQICDIKNSGYPTTDNQQQLVKGHNVKANHSITIKEKISFNPDYFFSSHLVVTAEDLVKWNECLHNGQLLKGETYKQMTSYTATSAHPLFGTEPIGYGYGLRINNSEWIKEIGHTGYHPEQGYTAVNLYYPESQTSVIVLENQAFENFDIAYYFESLIRQIILKSSLVKKD